MVAIEWGANSSIKVASGSIGTGSPLKSETFNFTFFVMV
jgi:hypothetical protein